MKKKRLIFLLLSIFFASIFTINVNAFITNSNYNNGWYVINVLDELGPDKALQIYGIRYYISDVTEPDNITGDIAINANSMGWYQVSFDYIDSTNQVMITDTYIELIRNVPFFTEADVLPRSVSDDVYPEIFINAWTSEITIDRYEIIDADGHIIIPEAAIDAAPRTGDDSMIVLFGFILIVAAMGLLFCKQQKVQRNMV
jgi:hypothetical protein